MTTGCAAPLNQSIRVGILEDDHQFSTYLCKIISEETGFSLVFCADTVAEALSAFKADPPDLLLVDMQLPDGSGLDLVRIATGKGRRILMLTVLADRKSVLAAFECGADGYLLKDTPPNQIVSDIKAAWLGGAPISAEAAKHLLALFQLAPADDTSSPTPREREVIQMLARGLTYAETGHALCISAHTVADYVKVIYRKLDVNSKSEAIFEARQQGWLRMVD